MDITISGRHTYVPEAFRNTVTEKLQKVELLDSKVQSVKVEISHENNPKLADLRIKVEITVFHPKAVIRSEVAASEAMVAFDMAFEKLKERLRRNRDRAKHHRTQVDKAGAELNIAELEAQLHNNQTNASGETNVTANSNSELEQALESGESVEVQLGDTPISVRKKVHTGEKISVSEALKRMELIGHDFYLFVHETTGRPAVLYRRRGWKYGVIELS